jgi:ubiquinone/menaquinone biosynthesis C-methylase UbiE
MALGTPLVDEQRRELLAAAGGRVLEIGFGTGLNLPHYPEGVRTITAVDPNPGMQRRGRRRVEEARVAVEQQRATAEELPFADASFETVVSTFTLCSVADARRAIREVRRVLVPGGQFLFLEHGLSPEPSVRRWQERLNWMQRLVGDGCRLDRRMGELISGAFGAVESEEFYLDQSPKTHGYVWRGRAVV